MRTDGAESFAVNGIGRARHGGLAGLLLLAVLACCASSVSAAPIAYPDLQVLMPTGDIAIVHKSATRTLEFTHITWNSGAGPFEIRPVYDELTGISQGYQALYTSPSPGVWTFAQTTPIVGPMIWEPPSDYRFPLDKFRLYSAASGGGLGSVVATSPKVDYCMTSDTRVGGVPNTPTNNEYPSSTCLKPEGRLGLSVGWGDQYEATDGGEGIEISSLPDGIYWLRGEVDPFHYFLESSASDNITDTKLQITGDTVKVLEQTHPESTPPSATLTSPVAGSTVSGTATLKATASGPAPISSVQFLLDGQPIGAPVTSPPYTLKWPLGSTTPGSHFLSAQATDSKGFIGTAPDVPVTVATSVGSIAIDSVRTATGKTTTTTPAFSTSSPGEVLLALVDADGPASGSQTVSVTGSGLAWKLLRRANSQLGDAEIWTATASGTLSNATVTALAADAGFPQSLTVTALSGANGIGTSASAAAASGAPTVSLTATKAGSVAFATGNDWDRGIARTLGSNQELLSETVEKTAGNTYWSQYDGAPSAAAGQTLTVNDTAPSTDRWNLAAVEVTPSPPSEPDSQPPAVSLIHPLTGQTVSNTIQLAANASDNVAVGSVQFFLDGKAFGAPVTKPPYALSWDTTTATNGSHTLTATAIDTSGNVGGATPATVTVQNPAAEEACFVVDLTTSAEGQGSVSTQTFTTAEPGEHLFAFVGADGPAGAGRQTASVTGAGLKWTLVKRSDSQSGDAEIWTATAPKPLANKTVKSTLKVKGFDQQLTLIAMQGSNGAGASSAVGAISGAPGVSLITTRAGSLVYGVGSDWDTATARALGPNQTLMRQDLDTVSGKTFWSQFTSALTGPVGETVALNDTAPTGDEWNMAAVEIISD
jgi:Bacterial Ig domain